MTKTKLFQYAVIWHPNEKEVKNGLKPNIIIDLTTVLAVDQNAASMVAAMSIPNEYRDSLDQIEIAIRPF